ncbi:MAG: ATP synthase subunit I [Actinomycetota bacterium]
MTDRPEREMVRRALMPGGIAVPAAAAIGWLLGGPDAGVSAAIGILLVLANFAAHGLSLAWASTVSVTAVHAVALGGFVVRLAVIVGVLFALNTLAWFSPLAFGLALVPATLLLLGYEARLMLRGVGAALQIPADPAAIRAERALAAREAD